MDQDAPDVQNEDAPRPYRLSRVGVKGVQKPVRVHRPGQEPHDVTVRFDLFVDLPSTQKGTHMSRNLEALADVLDGHIVDREARSVENLCRRIAASLLERHDYAQEALVRAQTTFFLPQKNPGGKPTLEAYGLEAEAHARRRGDGAPSVRRRLGVRVVGASACPCAMEVARHKFAEAGKPVPEDLPFITHNQRNILTLRLDLPDDLDLEAAELVALCEGSLSAPTFEYLKRGDEGDLVIQAHHDPKFVEDVVREALHQVTAQWPELPDATCVFASSEAEESIHKHNAYAERETTLGELRA
ncbi:MAG: GTP cyclohydrolase MptA [Thermoplasmatota archaeon]